MGSGIVFVVIIGLWAVILVPMWLRNHDAAVESKSVDRFSTAMRSLSRRGTGRGAGSRDMLVPGTRTAPLVTGGRAPAATARRELAARQARMRRRRSAALGLVGFFAVLLVATVVGAAPAWLPVVGLVALVGYAWHLRTVAVREARAERRRRRAAVSAPAAPVRRPAVRAAARNGVVEVAPTWPVGAEPAASGDQADTAVVATADDGWAPTPVVLPTYVTAPPATSVPRVIDLTHPGSWSAASMLDAVAASNAAASEAIFDQYEEPAAPAAPAASAGAVAEYAAEHEAVAETVAGSTSQPFLDDDAVFDQDDDEQFLAFLDRRAAGG